MILYYSCRRPLRDAPRCARLHVNGAWRCVTWTQSPPPSLPQRYQLIQTCVESRSTSHQFCTDTKFKLVIKIPCCMYSFQYIFVSSKTRSCLLCKHYPTRYFYPKNMCSMLQNVSGSNSIDIFRRLAKPKIYLICRIMQTETCLSLFLVFRFHIRVK